MAWNLTEEEQDRLMTVVGDLVDPWMGRHESTITWVNEDGSTKPMTIHPVGLKEDAPDYVRQLEAVYGDIIEKGAIIGGPLPGESDG